MALSTLLQRWPKVESLKLTKPQQKVEDALQVFLASLFIAICAQIKIHLYFTPVPLSGVTFATVFVGAVLGSRKGSLAVLCYLIERSLGFPAWSVIGNFGFSHLLDFCGGYRFAWVLQAFFVGLYRERSTFHFAKTVLALFIICLMQLFVGTLWLGCFIGFKNVMLMGFYPFIPGELLKVFLVTFYLKFRK